VKLVAQIEDSFLVETRVVDGAIPMPYGCVVDWDERKLRVPREVNLLSMFRQGYWESPAVSDDVEKEILSFVDEELSKLLTMGQQDIDDYYDPRQARDKRGRWSRGGGGISGVSGGVSASTSSPTMSDLERFDTSENEYVHWMAGAQGYVGTAELKIHVAASLEERLKDNEDYQEFSKKANLTEFDLVRQWAETSADNEPLSVILQLAANKEFGLKGTRFKHMSQEGIEEYYSLYGGKDVVTKGSRAFVRAMYDETQAEFAKAGIKELTVFRGMSLSRDQVASAFGADAVPSGLPITRRGAVTFGLQPMSSFSVSLSTASSFASGTKFSVVMATKVPVSRVVGTPRTGFGARAEHEVVVLGGKNFRADVVIASASALVKGRYDPISWAMDRLMEAVKKGE